MTIVKRRETYYTERVGEVCYVLCNSCGKESVMPNDLSLKDNGILGVGIWYKILEKDLSQYRSPNLVPISYDFCSILCLAKWAGTK